MYSIKLMNRWEKKFYKSSSSVPDKPRIKLQRDGVVEYIPLSETGIEKPTIHFVYNDLKLYFSSGVDLFNFDLAWNDFRNLIPNGVIVTSFEKFGNEGQQGVWDYTKSVMCPLDNKIYQLPYNETRVRVFDPETETFSYFGNFVADYHAQGSVFVSENIMVGTPYNSRVITFLDVSTKSITFLGEGLQRTKGATLHPNGKVYGVPTDPDDRILEIDPIKLSFKSVGATLITNFSWERFIVAPNKKLYTVPYSSPSILEFDPETETSVQFGSLGTTQYKCSGGCLHPNGKIYFSAYFGSYVLELDPDINTVSNFGISLGTGTYKYGIPTVAPNGKMYAPPYKENYMLEIDPTTKTVTKIHLYLDSVMGQGDEFILTKNGKMYSMPLYSTHGFMLNVGTTENEGIFSSFF